MHPFLPKKLNKGCIYYPRVKLHVTFFNEKFELQLKHFIKSMKQLLSTFFNSFGSE